MQIPAVGQPAAKTHDPCCSSHGASLDCDTYRRTHFVEVCLCCDTWAEKDHYGGWAPRGCPAGFSSGCSYWTSSRPCRCLEATLSTAVPVVSAPNIPATPETAIDILTDAFGQIPAARALLRTASSELEQILATIAELRGESR